MFLDMNDSVFQKFMEDTVTSMDSDIKVNFERQKVENKSIDLDKIVEKLSTNKIKFNDTEVSNSMFDLVDRFNEKEGFQLNMGDVMFTESIVLEELKRVLEENKTVKTLNLNSIKDTGISIAEIIKDYNRINEIESNQIDFHNAKVAVLKDTFKGFLNEKNIERKVILESQAGVEEKTITLKDKIKSDLNKTFERGLFTLNAAYFKEEGITSSTIAGATSLNAIPPVDTVKKRISCSGLTSKCNTSINRCSCHSNCHGSRGWR